MSKIKMNIVEESRHLCHLPWRPVGLSVPTTRHQIVLVKGTTGMMAPKDQFVALAFYDENWHPWSDHWYDMNNDHFADAGWKVTHWCEL